MKYIYQTRYASIKVSDTCQTNIASVGPVGTYVDWTNNVVSVRRDWHRLERVKIQTTN